MYDYVTIERSYACGGHEIASILAKKLNYRLYDDNVLVETCKRLNMPYNMLSNLDEQAPIGIHTKFHGEKLLPLEEQIYRTESEIIRDAAAEPGCIFIGRCASEMIKDKTCLRVFITADLDFRKNRALNVEKIPPKELDHTMKKFDTRRKKFFTAHAHAKWGTVEFFDLVLDSGHLGIETCAEILVTACRIGNA